MTDGRFPSMPDYPVQPWLSEMPGATLEERLAQRRADIIVISNNVTELFRSIDDFTAVSEEAIAYMSLRIARGMVNQHDEGFQQCYDATNTRLRRLVQDHRVAEALSIDIT